MMVSRGIALVTAILVVAIASLAATAVLSSANLSIHRTAALRDTEQAWWMAQGVESWILGILALDAQDNDSDGLGEPWAEPVDYLPVDQGFVSGRIDDAQGKFNLNNLVYGDKLEIQAAWFERLLASLPEVEVPPGLVGAIQDWIDAGQDPRFPGAEDTAYLTLDRPYRTGDRPFTMVSELRAVQGMTDTLYRALTTGCTDRPPAEGADGAPPPVGVSCISALPEKTTVNVNTAPLQVLAALPEQAGDTSALEAFLASRIETHYNSVQEFIDADIIAVDNERKSLIGTATQWFTIRGQIVIGSSRLPLYSLVKRPGSGPPPVVFLHSTTQD